MDKLIAVYGTLKIGNHNHDVFLKGYQPIQSGYFKIPFQIYSNGRYPMLIPDSPHQIHLEIYRIPEQLFQKIKTFEEPFGYHLESTTIDGIDVSIFVFNEKTPPSEFYPVSDGCFKPEVEW